MRGKHGLTYTGMINEWLTARHRKGAGRRQRLEIYQIYKIKQFTTNRKPKAWPLHMSKTRWKYGIYVSCIHLRSVNVYPQNWFFPDTWTFFSPQPGINFLPLKFLACTQIKISIPHTEVFPKCLFEGKWGHFASLTCSGLSALCPLWRGEWAAGENKHNVPNRPFFFGVSRSVSCVPKGFCRWTL